MQLFHVEVIVLIEDEVKDASSKLLLLLFDCLLITSLKSFLVLIVFPFGEIVLSDILEFNLANVDCLAFFRFFELLIISNPERKRRRRTRC